MRRRWTLIAVFAALAVLVGVLVILKVKPNTTEATTESTSIEIPKIEDDKIAAVVLKNANGGFSISKKQSAWTASPASITLDENSVAGLTSAFGYITIQSLVDENPTDLAQYGLSKPQATAILTSTDGTMITYLLGDKSPTGASYYFQVQGDPKVYTVYTSVGERMLWKITDLRGKTLTPAINADEITYFRIREQNGAVIEIQEKTDAEAKDTSLGLGKFIVTKPYSYPIGCDPEPTDTLVRAPTSLSILDFVDDAPKSLAPYGLDRPWGELLMRDKSNTLGLQFGADKDSYTVYFKVTGKPSVYTISKSSLSFMETKPFSVIEKFVYLGNIDDMERIDIESPRGTHVITMTRTVKKAQAEGEEDETITTFTVDGKNIEDKSFRDFYQILIGTQVEGELEGKPTRNPAATFRFTRNKGDRLVTIRYYPYDQDFYGVTMGSKIEFVVSKSQLAKTFDALDMLLKGEPPPQ
jgi:hypothetical protein